MTDDRYEVVTWRGHQFDKYTVAALEEAERLLGYELDYTQGSLSTSVSASGSTHAGLGAGDCNPTAEPKRVVRILRSVGFAAWHRLPLKRKGVDIWGEHIHFILIGDAKASPAALRQVLDYRSGLDGLAGRSKDTTWRPTPIPTFDYEEATMPTAEEIAKALLKTKIKTDDAPDGRYVSSILQKLYNDAYPAKKK